MFIEKLNNEIFDLSGAHFPITMDFLYHQFYIRIVKEYEKSVYL